MSKYGELDRIPSAWDTIMAQRQEQPLNPMEQLLQTTDGGDTSQIPSDLGPTPQDLLTQWQQPTSAQARAEVGRQGEMGDMWGSLYQAGLQQMGGQASPWMAFAGALGKGVTGKKKAEAEEKVYKAEEEMQGWKHKLEVAKIKYKQMYHGMAKKIAEALNDQNPDNDRDALQKLSALAQEAKQTVGDDLGIDELIVDFLKTNPDYALRQKGVQQGLSPQAEQQIKFYEYVAKNDKKRATRQDAIQKWQEIIDGMNTQQTPVRTAEQPKQYTPEGLMKDYGFTKEQADRYLIQNGK